MREYPSKIGKDAPEYVLKSLACPDPRLRRGVIAYSVSTRPFILQA